MSYTGWVVLAICFLSGGTLFFSVNAIALRIFSHVKLQEAFKAANKADLTDRLISDAENLILTCSFFRLIFNMCILLTLISLFAKRRQAEPAIGDYVLTSLIAAAIFLIFSLVIPHAWAKYRGEKVLSSSFGVLRLFATIMAPVLCVGRFTDGFVRRLAGVTESTPQQQQEQKQEEFLNGLKQRTIEGVLDKEEQEMIENVFELSETTADQIMTPRTDIVAVEVNSDLQTVLATITSAGHTRVPVYEENIDKIVGLVYAKDLLAQIGRNPAEFKLREKMRDAYFVPETKLLRVLLREFRTQKQHIAIVLDEYGGTAGIVTLEDILEELVGEITDEYEVAPPEPIKKVDRYTIDVDARTPIDDINDQFDSDLPEDEDYDTIGGFVFSQLGYVPKTGESFDYEDMKFTIVSAEARRIRLIRIKKRVDE